MKCEACNSTDLSVTDSRSITNGVYRRRKCNKCSNKFSTIEIGMDSIKELRSLSIKFYALFDSFLERSRGINMKKQVKFVKTADDGEEFGGVHIDEDEIRKALM